MNAAHKIIGFGSVSPQCLFFRKCGDELQDVHFLGQWPQPRETPATEREVVPVEEPTPAK